VGLGAAGVARGAQARAGAVRSGGTPSGVSYPRALLTLPHFPARRATRMAAVQALR
jgi:hypothetical protein